MPVLAILTCEVLEDEIAHIILQDPEIVRVGIIDSDHSKSISGKLSSSKQFCTVSLREAADFMPQAESFGLIINVLEVGLHMVKERLKDAVMQQINELMPYCDAILLGYGLCGNSLEHLDEWVRELPVTVAMPTNKDGSRIDDCVCMVLGGTSQYLDEVKKVAGTWFVTPGWLKHWETLLLRELGAKDIATVKWIFDKVGYSRVLMVNAHTSETEKFYADSQEFANKFGFYTEEREGTLEILERTYREAKEKARVANDTRNNV